MEGQRGETRNLREAEDSYNEIFEEVVNPTFHSGSRGLATKVFGTTPPVDILANLQSLYGKQSYQELNAVLLSLNEPINIMQPVEFMIRGIE